MFEAYHQHSMEMAVLLHQKKLSTFLQFQEGWGDFSPSFNPVQQESCLLIKSKDIFYSSRELNFDLCESGLQRLTKVDLLNRESLTLNLQD